MKHTLLQHQSKPIVTASSWSKAHKKINLHTGYRILQHLVNKISIQIIQISISTQKLIMVCINLKWLESSEWFILQMIKGQCYKQNQSCIKNAWTELYMLRLRKIKHIGLVVQLSTKPVFGWEIHNAAKLPMATQVAETFNIDEQIEGIKWRSTGRLKQVIFLS